MEILVSVLSMSHSTNFETPYRVIALTCGHFECSQTVENIRFLIGDKKQPLRPISTKTYPQRLNGNELQYEIEFITNTRLNDPTTTEFRDCQPTTPVFLHKCVCASGVENAAKLRRSYVTLGFPPFWFPSTMTSFARESRTPTRAGVRFFAKSSTDRPALTYLANNRKLA